MSHPIFVQNVAGVVHLALNKGVYVVGGLGGGGDVGLALLLAASSLKRVEIAVVSFTRCRTGDPGVRRHRIQGALIKPDFYSERNIEYSIMLHVPDLRVYSVCTRDPWPDVVSAVDYVAEEIGPDCWVAADIGGDGLLTGYESQLGSYKTDTFARAALAVLRERRGVPGLIAIGGLGLEGGRRKELNDVELVATLLWHKERGAFRGVYLPNPDLAWIGEALLSARGPSGEDLLFTSVMLPLYVAALRGQMEAVVERGYSVGKHRLEWWHKYVFLLDTLESCMDSPLCKITAESGRIPKAPLDPPREYMQLVEYVKDRGYTQVIDEIVEKSRVYSIKSACRKK